jgi:hypothetical protein
MPAPATVSFDETALQVTWAAPPEGSDGLAYHVYEVRPSVAGAEPEEIRLTKTPAPNLTFEDSRIEWGTKRCYTVRAARTVDTLWVEGDAPPPTCVTMTDTFAPAPPSGLTAIASVGAISLIWDASAAVDLAGYLVLKGAPGAPLAPVGPAPMQETTFRDVVPSGTRVAYAIRAADKAGNASDPSAIVEETAR